MGADHPYLALWPFQAVGGQHQRQLTLSRTGLDQLDQSMTVFSCPMYSSHCAVNNHEHINTVKPGNRGYLYLYFYTLPEIKIQWSSDLYTYIILIGSWMSGAKYIASLYAKEAHAYIRPVLSACFLVSQLQKFLCNQSAWYQLELQSQMICHDHMHA